MLQRNQNGNHLLVFDADILIHQLRVSFIWQVLGEKMTCVWFLSLYWIVATTCYFFQLSATDANKLASCLSCYFAQDVAVIITVTAARLLSVLQSLSVLVGNVLSVRHVSLVGKFPNICSVELLLFGMPFQRGHNFVLDLEYSVTFWSVTIIQGKPDFSEENFCFSSSKLFPQRNSPQHNTSSSLL